MVSLMSPRQILAHLRESEGNLLSLEFMSGEQGEQTSLQVLGMFEASVRRAVPFPDTVMATTCYLTVVHLCPTSL